MLAQPLRVAGMLILPAVLSACAQRPNVPTILQPTLGPPPAPQLWLAPGQQDPTPPPPTPRIQMATDLIYLIQHIVAPDTWTPGTGTSCISELDGRLIITTRRENHEAIAKLLAHLREQRSVSFQLSATFIEVPAARDHLLSRFVADYGGIWGSEGILTTRDAAEFSRIAGSLPEARIATMPHLFLHNGETICAAALQTRQVRVKDTDGLGTVPMRFREGDLLQVCATASEDRQYITVTTSPRVSRLGPGGEEYAFAGSLNLVTTMTIPSGGSLLLKTPICRGRIRGTKGNEVLTEWQPLSQETNSQLYVLITPSLTVSASTKASRSSTTAAALPR